MSDYVALMVFPNNSVTYEALTKLQNTAGGLGVDSAAIIEREDDGRLTVPAAGDSRAGLGFFSGSLIGMFVGVLGGPLGLLLGWTAGAVTGAVVDVRRADKSDDVISEFASAVLPGTNAIVAETNEADNTALDAFVASFGGQISRRSTDEVLDALEAQKDAEEQARKAAKEAMKQAKSDERKASREEREAALKARFEDDKNKVESKA